MSEQSTVTTQPNLGLVCITTTGKIRTRSDALFFCDKDQSENAEYEADDNTNG
jgi:hypothetical protein